MYYPFGGALATLDHQLSNALLAAPVTLASGNPVLGHNVFLLTTFVLSGFTMFLLVRALTGSGAAGLVAGGIFAFAPFRIEQLVHTPIMASFWLPLVLLATHRYVLAPRWGRLLLVVAVFVAQSLASWYYAAMALVAVTVVGVWSLAAGAPQWRRVLARAGVGAGVSVLLLVPFALPYTHVIGHELEQVEAQASDEETADGTAGRLGALFPSEPRVTGRYDLSAEVQNYLGPTPDGRSWTARALQGLRKTEAGFFPGTLATFLAALALMGTPSHDRAGRRHLPLVLVLAVGALPIAAVACAAAGNPDAWPVIVTRRLSLVTLAGVTARVELGPVLTVGRAEVLFDGMQQYDARDGLRNYELFPGDQRFLMLKAGTATDTLGIILIQNWFDELQRLVPSP